MFWPRKQQKLRKLETFSRASYQTGHCTSEDNSKVSILGSHKAAQLDAELREHPEGDASSEVGLTNVTPEAMDIYSKFMTSPAPAAFLDHDLSCLLDFGSIGVSLGLVEDPAQVKLTSKLAVEPKEEPK